MVWHDDTFHVACALRPASAEQASFFTGNGFFFANTEAIEFINQAFNFARYGKLIGRCREDDSICFFNIRCYRIEIIVKGAGFTRLEAGIASMTRTDI